MRSNFDLLLDEIHSADRARSRGALQKATGGDWVGDWVRGRREREAAAVGRSLEASPGTLDRLTAEMGALAKAMPVPSRASPREAFAKAFGHFKQLVAEGRLTGLDACKAEAHLHHIADKLRAGGHL